MSDNRENKLIVSIIQYFRNKILSGQLAADQSESLEVAIQCLESGFNVDSTDQSLHTDVDLLSLFSAKAENFKQPTDADKDEADRLKNNGNDLMKDGKFQEAVNSYSAAINLFRSPIFYCNRAAAFSKLEKHQESINDCKTALQLDPAYSKAYGRMGLAYSCMNRYPEARDAYRKALELEPNNDSFKNNLKIAEDKVEETSRRAGPGLGGAPGGGGLGGFPGLGGLGGFNPMELLNNPAMLQMAQQFMNDPNMQNMMTNLMGMGVGGGGASTQNAPPPAPEEPTAQHGQQPTPPMGVNNLLEMGQRLASQMQAQNPELVEQLRRQFQQQHGPSNPNQDQNDQQHPPEPPPPSS